MSSPNFRFKQFTVWHDKCAMKVGTDGVLLGAWCPIHNNFSTLNTSPYRLLDIGTGSGLIALMLAQRLSYLYQTHHPTYHIDAIDIDSDAVTQAKENFALSPWTKHLHAHQSALQEWKTQTTNSEVLYDLIISNPPYFQQSLKNPNTQRATARHADTLKYSELILHATRLLKPCGTLAFVLPIEAEEEILGLSKEFGLYPTHITHVYSKPSKPAKRLLIALSSILRSNEAIAHCPYTHPIVKTFYIESANSPRSEDYKTLTQDFYL